MRELHAPDETRVCSRSNTLFNVGAAAASARPTSSVIRAATADGSTKLTVIALPLLAAESAGRVESVVEQATMMIATVPRRKAVPTPRRFGPLGARRLRASCSRTGRTLLGLTLIMIPQSHRQPRSRLIGDGAGFAHCGIDASITRAHPAAYRTRSGARNQTARRAPNPHRRSPHPLEHAPWHSRAPPCSVSDLRRTSPPGAASCLARPSASSRSPSRRS